MLATEMPLEMSLVEAAFTAGLDYAQLRTRLIRREVEGRRSATGRWFIPTRVALALAAERKESAPQGDG